MSLPDFSHQTSDLKVLEEDIPPEAPQNSRRFWLELPGHGWNGLPPHQPYPSPWSYPLLIASSTMSMNWVLRTCSKIPTKNKRSSSVPSGQTFTYTCDNYVTYTCIRHLHMQAILLRHLHMRPLFLHGNVARHSKDTSTCTLLYLETSGFRGGVSGWGFGVGFWGGVSGWGFGVGFRDGVVMTCAPHGNVERHSKDTSTCTLLYLETSGFRGGFSGWGRDDVRPAWKRGAPQQRHFHMHTPLLYLETSGFRGGVSGWGFGVGFRGFGVGSWCRARRMETWHDTARTLPHAHSSIWRLQGFGASGWGFGVGFRGFGLGFRGGVVMPCAPHGNVAPRALPHARSSIWRLQGFGAGSWWRAPAWKRGTPQQRHFHMHTPLFGDFRVSGWGFGVQLRGGVSGWGFGVGFRGGVVMTCAPHGNVERHSKDTSTCTLLYLETSGFRGGVSGWGRDDVRPGWKRGTPQQRHFHMHTPLFGDFRVSGWGFGVGLRGYQKWFKFRYASGHGMWNQHSKQTRIALENNNFVASAFLHYKISTQKCFRPC